MFRSSSRKGHILMWTLLSGSLLLLVLSARFRHTLSVSKRASLLMERDIASVKETSHKQRLLIQALGISSEEIDKLSGGL